MDEIWAYGPGEEINEENCIRFHRKRLESTPARLELFDMEKDPYEQNNVYDPGYAKVRELPKAKLLKLKREVDDRDELVQRREQAWKN